MPASPSLLDLISSTKCDDEFETGEVTRVYADKMLLAALQEAQSVVRSYDQKAQIVGVGYILALNLVMHFGDLLPGRAPHGPIFFAVVWGIVIMPILQLGQVLYPGRRRAEKDLLTKTSRESDHRVFYVNPDRFADLQDFVQQALRSDWTQVLSAELLKLSYIRIIKQARVRRGLIIATLSFIVIGSDQLVRSFAIA